METNQNPGNHNSRVPHPQRPLPRGNFFGSPKNAKKLSPILTWAVNSRMILFTGIMKYRLDNQARVIFLYDKLRFEIHWDNVQNTRKWDFIEAFGNFENGRVDILVINLKLGLMTMNWSSFCPKALGRSREASSIIKCQKMLRWGLSLGCPRFMKISLTRRKPPAIAN